MFIKSIPNMFTVGNLFLGIISIILVFNNRPDMAAIMVVLAILMDGLDGRVARALNVQSEFGKELDSLSDVISFGVAPAFIMYVTSFQEMNAMGWIVTAIFPICGALRLARFNVVEGTPGYFIGLPIPAAGGILSTLALFHNDIHPFILMASTLALSFLMISTLKYPSFKKLGLRKSTIWVTPFLIVLALALALLFKGNLAKLIFIPMLLYALYGLKKNVEQLILRKKRHQAILDEPINQEIRF
ncbi:MAG: CDP-diacylglycerol--serine O-phosphatidyltransferase [Paenibacillus sp. RIFOXYA1_FULL_44_5]|nr:MAG: CDP-diacylglycerol--serine O-phosphatidyltransferase [Paenibacillus sp. RIFOXYA1_FULL_44_5]